MAILVTGGAGYIGSQMVWELLDHGEEVVVIDRLSSGSANVVPPGARLIRGDAGDAGLLRKVLEAHPVEAILHFAGSVLVPESVTDPLAYYANNVCNTRALLEAAVEAGVPRFILSSSAAVYGSAGDRPIGEDHPIQPLSPYGRSKWMAETILTDVAAASGLSFAILRYFNVAGADPKGRSGQSTRKSTHLIKVACEAAAGKRGPVSIFGQDYPTRDGTCIRDYIHVSDLVAVHRLVLEHLRAGGEDLVANCGYGNGFSVLEVLDCLRRVSGSALPVQLEARRPGDAASVVADSTRLRSVLGWQPRFNDLERICADALRWERTLTADSLEPG